MPALAPPVDAPIVRPFAYAGSPFAAGLHRGIDLAAPPGARVLAPCTGTVAYAGAHGVTLACAGERVTLLPLRAVAVRVGQRVQAGSPVARVGSGAAHRGLHLGVRRAGDPFGYVDPAPLLRRPASPAPLGPAPPPGDRRRPAPPGPPSPEAPRAAAPRAGSPAPQAARPAPVAAWSGLALAAAAAAGSARLRGRRRRRGRHHPRHVPDPVTREA